MSMNLVDWWPFLLFWCTEILSVSYRSCSLLCVQFLPYSNVFYSPHPRKCSAILNLHNSPIFIFWLCSAILVLSGPPVSPIYFFPLLYVMVYMQLFVYCTSCFVSPLLSMHHSTVNDLNFAHILNWYLILQNYSNTHQKFGTITVTSMVSRFMSYVSGCCWRLYLQVSVGIHFLPTWLLKLHFFKLPLSVYTFIAHFT